MTWRRLITAAGIALVVAMSPVTSDPETALGVGLSTASCTEGECGDWTLFLDCMCPDVQRPNHWPRCGEPVAP